MSHTASLNKPLYFQHPFMFAVHLSRYYSYKYQHFKRPSWHSLATWTYKTTRH